MCETLEGFESAASKLRAEQLARWADGDRVRLEALLTPGEGLAGNSEAILDLIYAEVLLREEYGERPGLDEYLHRFPHLAEELRRQFGLHEALRTLETEVPSRPDASLTTRPGLPASRTAISPGLSTGPYEILEEIGRGGMGIVYKARHTVTGRLAALKMMRPGEGEEERARFVTEAQAVAALNHPNVVRIYEVFAPDRDGTPFVALEYAAGGNLAAHVNGTPLPPGEAAGLLQALADAMAHAHQAGIVHRDLKPANILLSGGDGAPESATPKITDFGLARRLDTRSGQTRTGAVLGTPSYMAPEQAAGRTNEVGPAADVYALGAILYELLTGRPPFKGVTVFDTLAQVQQQEPVAPRQLNPASPRDLETICLKCLHKEPTRRYASSRELADDLARYRAGEPIRARPTGPAERVGKWIRRRPGATALLGVTGLALVALVVVWVSFTIRLEEQRRQALRERDRAEEHARNARLQSEEARKQSERAAHLLTLTASAVDAIAFNVRGGKLDESRPRDSGQVLFKLASFYARASAALAADQALPTEDRQRLKDQYAVSAVRLLNCAEQAGYFERSGARSREALDKEPNLAILRDRPDYQTFRERLR